MTKSEHERERRAFWDACCAAATEHFCDEHANSDALRMAEFAADLATAKLTERDKMFPGPVEEPVIRRCDSCNHRDSSAVEPCGSCVGYARWEPRK